MNILPVSNRIVAKVIALATQRNLSTIELLNEVLEVYENMEKLQVFEKQLADNKYNVITIHKYGICIEDITRRTNIDSFSDLDLIINNGYYSINYGKQHG